MVDLRKLPEHDMRRMVRIKPVYARGSRMHGDWTSVSRPLRQALRLVVEGDKDLDYSSAEVHLDRTVISPEQAIEFIANEPLL
jgi:hypothetical protein